ncbi:helix-turn-helix transcriptional regulator [Bifidobacterium saguini]|uniref:Helix-turn-helix transcriptional regulator n=1 Tax=Bifidobacterium saguini TaxID=762210 RepID=A0ABX7SC27_9BIFI|nr:helix-turn-helix transcriptional regulator [Bifidobacterium saguini]QTB90803.1 helix-turn-helix transcriptional regulator [Bifidobacterium saguini]QTB90865.1 helix-turn-helix transcriptional regulator [Bifidobacterium saguini]
MNTLEYSKSVAENVAKALDGANLSISTVAERTGIPRTTLSRHLNHPETAPFDVIELSRIAKLTRKTVSSLVRVKSPALAGEGVE